MIPLNHTRVAPADAIRAASAFADRMSARRSVREFSPAPHRHRLEQPFLEIAPAVIVVFEVHQGSNSPRPYYGYPADGACVPDLSRKAFSEVMVRC
jgi:hypothetical protein